MDSDTIYEHAKSRFDHAQNQKLLREKYQSKMKFAYNGGMWKAGPTLINILSLMRDETSLVIEDLYQNPIEINPTELLEISKERWQEQMSGWLVEYNTNSKRR